jgi:predicted SprT family Zn-dependent metalloprotease
VVEHELRHSQCEDLECERVRSEDIEWSTAVDEAMAISNKTEGMRSEREGERESESYICSQNVLEMRRATSPLLTPISLILSALVK